MDICEIAPGFFSERLVKFGYALKIHASNL